MNTKVEFSNWLNQEIERLDQIKEFQILESLILDNKVKET